MRYFRFLLFFLLFFPCGNGLPAACAAGSQQEEPIVLLDLRNLLKKDLQDPESVKQVWDELHTVATLQGIVNRDRPSLYIRYVQEGRIDVDAYWWNKYRRPGEWLSERDTLVLSSVLEAIQYYKGYLKGLVVYDPNVASTSNVASSIAGIEDLIAVRYDSSPQSLYRQIRSACPDLKVQVRLVREDGSSLFTGKGLLPDLPVASCGSVKNDPYRWFIEKYLKKGRCNTAYAAYYIDQYWRKKPLNSVPNHHTLTNHDFFVSKRAFFFDLSPWSDEAATDEPSQPVGSDFQTLQQFLELAYRQNRGETFCYIGGFPSWAFKYTKHAGGKHDDVPTEWEFSRLISAYNAFKDADAIGYGALANASFWQHFPLEDKYPQPWITRSELEERGLLDADGIFRDKGKKYVIFYVKVGDF